MGRLTDSLKAANQAREIRIAQLEAERQEIMRDYDRSLENITRHALNTGYLYGQLEASQSQ